MKLQDRIVLFIFFFSVFPGCEKDSATKILGTWERAENNYIITVKEDYKIKDIYNQGWAGLVELDSDTYEADDFYLEASSVFGNYILYSESIGIYMHLFVNRIVIGTNSSEHTYIGEYESNVNEGHIAAEGIAYNPYTNPTESINFSVDLQAQGLQMYAGSEYSFPDVFYFTKNLIWKITFKDGGVLSGSILDLDLVFSISGNWEVGKDDQLSMNWYCFDLMLTVDKEYTFSISHPDTLCLFEEYSAIGTFEYSDLIPEEIIEQINYELVFCKN